MDKMQLRRGELLVTLDAKRESLRFERSGRRLPWELDLGKTISVTVRRGTSATSGAPGQVRLSELTLRRLSATHLQWIGEVSGAGVALDVELTPAGLVFGVSPLGTGRAEVVSARWPGELRFEGDAREVCWADAGQGALFRADGKPWKGVTEWTHTAARFYGFTCDAETLAVIVDTPFDAEATFEDDGAARMTSTLTWKPSFGTLTYPRRVRFLVLAESGYVAVANAFRAYAQDHGLWKSWEERVDENPEVEKLRGAFIAGAGYYYDEGADQLAAMKAMRKSGFTRGYLFSPKMFKFGDEWRSIAEANRVTDDEIRQIQDLGYLCAPFLQVEEAGSSVGEEKFARDADGQFIKRWQMGELKFYEIAKWRIPGMLPALDDRLQACNAVHFDTLTAMRLVENHGERPYDHRGDVRLRMELADTYRRHGKVIGSEGLRDWGVRHVDLATSKTFTPVSRADPRVWTVPLTDLVYHDSTVRSHWEHHAYDDDRGVRNLVLKKYHPFAMELNDLLTCSPPVLFPEGMLYTYGLKEITRPDGTPDVAVDWTKTTLYKKRITDLETQAALPRALRVCRLNERHGVSRMLTHRFVDPQSPFVQESEFASGARVVVNFGEELFTLADGRTVGARAALVEE